MELAQPGPIAAAYRQSLLAWSKDKKECGGGRSGIGGEGRGVVWVKAGAIAAACHLPTPALCSGEGLPPMLNGGKNFVF